MFTKITVIIQTKLMAVKLLGSLRDVIGLFAAAWVRFCVLVCFFSFFTKCYEIFKSYLFIYFK